VTGDEPGETGDLGFRWRRFESGDVEITREGRVVTVLRGDAAVRFVTAVASGDPQRIMARVTGNYRRGNEQRQPPRGSRP
jgi:hypothetical protein